MFKNISLNLMELLFLTSALIFFKNYLYQLKIKTIFPFFICVICFQLSILYNDFKLSSKKSFIVFNHSNTLLGFRNGKKLLIIGSSSENWEKVKRNIIDPYTIGERISSVQYKTLQMNTVYKWERKKILVLNKPGKNNMDSANYILPTNCRSLKNRRIHVLLYLRVIKSNTQMVKTIKALQIIGLPQEMERLYVLFSYIFDLIRILHFLPFSKIHPVE